MGKVRSLDSISVNPALLIHSGNLSAALGFLYGCIAPRYPLDHLERACSVDKDDNLLVANTKHDYIKEIKGYLPRPRVPLSD